MTINGNIPPSFPVELLPTFIFAWNSYLPMRFYEYKCKVKGCGGEQLVRANEPLDQKSLEALACEKCQAHEMERKISAPYIGGPKPDDRMLPLPGNHVLVGKEVARIPLESSCGRMHAELRIYAGEVAKQTEMN